MTQHKVALIPGLTGHLLARKEHEFERLRREIAALRSELKIERLDT